MEKMSGVNALLHKNDIVFTILDSKQRDETRSFATSWLNDTNLSHEESLKLSIMN